MLVKTRYFGETEPSVEEEAAEAVEEEAATPDIEEILEAED